MDRVAVITGVRGNLPALEAVERAIDWTDVDAIDCGCAYVDPRDRVVADIERVEYDAEAVGREATAAGLPEELAEKLTSAA